MPDRLPIAGNIEAITLSIREISDAAAQQEDCVRFDIGQPSFDTPERIKDAARERLAEQQGYSPTLGRDELRAAIARSESAKGLSLSKENVMVAPGGTGALFAAITAADGTVLMNDPSWAPYRLITNVTEASGVQLLYFDEDGALTDQFRDAVTDAAAAIVNTPSNPEGRVLSKAQAQAIGAVCEDAGTTLIADEVYHRITFDATHHSPAQYCDDSMVIGSASKNFAMTGWRIGWITGAPGTLEELAKVTRAITASPSTIGQMAVTEALKGGDAVIADMCEAYRERRDVTVERMRGLGWDFTMPEGAIYAFPRVGEDSWTFARAMLEEGVALVPGEPFGPGSDEHVRICFGSVEVDDLERGFDRIENAL